MKKTLLCFIILSLLSSIILGYFLFFDKGEAKLRISSGQPGGIYLPLAQNIAKVVQQEYPEIKMEVMTSISSGLSIERLEKNEADLALIQNDTPGGKAIRTVLPLYKEVFFFLVPKKSRIKKIHDIAGAKIAVGEEGSGTELLVRNFLKHYGFDEKNMTPVHVGLAQATRQLLSGEIDAMMYVAGIKPSVLKKLMATGKFRLIGFSRPASEGGEVNGFCIEHPFVSPYIIPVYCFHTDSPGEPGEPDKPISTLAVRSLLVARKDLPLELIRKITAAIFANRQNLIAEQPIAAEISENFSRDELQYPLHPGSRAFFDREKPSFLVRYSECMGFILSVMICIYGLLAGLKQWIERKMKDRIDKHYVKLDKLFLMMESGNLEREELFNIKSQLREIRNKAYHELVSERLLANDSFRIFQSLLSDCQKEADAQLNAMGADINSKKEGIQS